MGDEIKKLTIEQERELKNAERGACRWERQHCQDRARELNDVREKKLDIQSLNLEDN